MRHLAFIPLVILILTGLPAWAEDEPATPPPEAPPAFIAEPPVPTSPAVAPIQPTPPASLPAPTAPTPPVGTRTTGPTPVTRRPALKTEVLDIRKTHNLPWRCSCTAVRLDIDFMVVGQRGRFIGARVDFYAQNGQPIQSVLYPFANQRGQVSAWTHLVRQTQDAARMHTALMIPYRAFPCACEGDNYLVTARVLLLRRDGRAQSSEIARGETTFTVWSSGEAQTEDGAFGDDWELELEGAGGDASSRADEEYRRQSTFGNWPDHTGLEKEWDARTRENSAREATKMDRLSPTPPTR